MVLEEIFNYRSGESHSCLTTDIMNRLRDNLFMQQAHDILLKVFFPDFGISL